MTDLLFSGRYKTEKLLASHDAVKTWRGRDVATGNAVIIKALDVGKAGSTQEVELFERQGNVLSQLRHPMIPEVFSTSQEDVEGRPTLVLVTQCVDGDNVEARVTSGMSLDERGIITLGIEVARILEFLHGRLPPIVHRDVKPSNLVQDKGGALHLVDFGSVKLPGTASSSSRGATVVGTYGYMPPEQFEGGATPASDVHALGMTLLYLATHKHPWEHGDGGPRAAMTSSPGLSSGLRALLRHMTEPEPRSRIADGKQARVALEQLLAPPKRLAPWLALAASVLLIGTGGAVMTLMPREKPVDRPTYVPPPPIPPMPPAPPPPPVEVKQPMFFPSGLGQANRCLTRAVPRILQSRGRYLSWQTSENGPNCQERYISYGLYEGYDDAIGLCDSAAEGAPESLRAQVRAVAELTRTAIPLLKTADRYYDEARYKDDNCKGAKAMHGPLMAVFNGMLSSGMALEERLLKEDGAALEAAARRHADHPVMRDAVALLSAYYRVAMLSPASSDDTPDRAKLLAATQEALDLSEKLEAAPKETLLEHERTAVTGLLGHSSAYRVLARQLREPAQRGAERGQRDPLGTRERFLDAVVDIHLWAEPRR